MTPARWQQVKSLLNDLLVLDPARRRDELANIGAEDPALRAELESLIAAHEAVTDDFLEKQAGSPGELRSIADRDTGIGKHIGPFELVEVLGSGGMGEVYLARRDDAEFDQQVAIKLIRAGQDSLAIVARFKTERQILAQLDHPNIAKLLDGGRTPDGRPYFVMEYVPGLPITDYCDSKAH